MRNEGLYDKLRESQKGACALQSSDDCLMTIPDADGEDAHLWHLDHIVRKSKGGTWDADNLRIICVFCDWEREGNAPTSTYPRLDSAYREYQTWMSERKAITSRLKDMYGLESQKTKSPYLSSVTAEAHLRDLGRAKVFEKYFKKQITKELDRLARSVTMVNICRDVPFLGDITIALLLSRTDIRKATYPSSLCQYFGMGDPDDRNPGLGPYRAAFRQWSEVQVRSSGGNGRVSPYRAIYDDEKAKYVRRDDKKAHFKAMRNTSKIMLSHFWETYRKIEDLPVARPYAHGQLGHEDYLAPEDFGWIIPEAVTAK